MLDKDTYNAVPTSQVRLRWRMSQRTLPLAHRHINALAERGAGATMKAWVYSRVEQLLAGKAAAKNPDGVIVVDIDPAGEILIAIEECPTEISSEEAALLVDKDGAVIDARAASVWLRSGDVVMTPQVGAAKQRGTRSFVYDLAKTMGYQLEEHPLTPEQIKAADEMFLVSDAFGLVLVDQRGGELSQKLAAAFAKLWG